MSQLREDRLGALASPEPVTAAAERHAVAPPSMAPAMLRANALPFAGVVGLLVSVLAIFAPTTWSMVEVWQRSGTYAHGFLVLPIFVGWVWGSRAELSRLAVRPFWPGLPCMAGLGLVWLVADWMAAGTPSQLAVIALVPTAVATVYGLAWVRALALPFAFLFFAVPAGDALIPHMMEWTADFTVAALRLSGVPVYREDMHFWIPSGKWSVVEACSGIRYLIACAAVATVYAAAMYRSPRRRLAFIGAAVLCALVANWVRAYGIVLMAHLTNNKLAVGVDHLIFGWVFFTVILALIFFVGALWREEPAPAVRREAARDAPPARSKQAAAAAAAAAVVVCVWPIASRLGPAEHQDSSVAATIRPANGWTATRDPLVSWRPHLQQPAAEHVVTFEKDGSRVGVYLGAFSARSKHAKLWSSVNQLVTTTDRSWMQIGRGTVGTTLGSHSVDANAATISGTGLRIVAWHWYQTNGAATGSRSRAALHEAIARLRGRHATSYWVTVYALDAPHAGSGARSLEAFMRDMGGSLAAALHGSANSD